jgi:hypothetical protein
MDEVHMVSALTWTETFDLNQRMEGIREALAPIGWQDLEERMILNVCKAALDLDIYKSDIKDLTSKIRRCPEVLDEARENITAAASLLAEQCHVLGPGILPYSYQIVLLAEAMRQCDRRPSGEQKDLLRRWFWITTFSEYFGTGINSTRMRNALDHIRVLFDNGTNPRPSDMNTVVRPRHRFDFRAARSRALALLLAERNPLNPDGTGADAYTLLSHHGAGAMIKIVPNARAEDGRAADGPENRMVLAPVHVTRLRELLLESGSDEVRIEFLESHLIDDHAFEALRNGDSGQFFHLRRMAVRSLERQHVELYQLEYEE